MLFAEEGRFEAAQSCNFVNFLQIRSEQSLLGWMRFTLGGFRASCMSGHVKGRDQLLIKRLLLLLLLQYVSFQGRNELLIKQASDPTSSSLQ